MARTFDHETGRKCFITCRGWRDTMRADSSKTRSNKKERFQPARTFDLPQNNEVATLRPKKRNYA
jgi:hypothetical protein